jgi:hypothetical protein
MEFKKNDLVWIKSKGFPLWPGFIIDEKKAQFLGDNHQVNINDDNILNYNENFEKIINQKIRKRYYFDSYKFSIIFSELIKQKELNCDDFYDFLIFKNEQKLKFSVSDLKIFLSKFLKKDDLLKKFDLENFFNFSFLTKKNNKKTNKNNDSKFINKKRKKLDSKINKKNLKKDFTLKIVIPIDKENKKNDSISIEEEINSISFINSKVNSKIISGKNTSIQTKNEDEKNNSNEITTLNQETNFNNIVSMKNQIFDINKINKKENFLIQSQNNLNNNNNNDNKKKKKCNKNIIVEKKKDISF